MHDFSAAYTLIHQKEKNQEYMCAARTLVKNLETRLENQTLTPRTKYAGFIRNQLDIKERDLEGIDGGEGPHWQA
jgi:hypothetical protein